MAQYNMSLQSFVYAQKGRALDKSEIQKFEENNKYCKETDEIRKNLSSNKCSNHTDIYNSSSSQRKVSR